MTKTLLKTTLLLIGLTPLTSFADFTNSKCSEELTHSGDVQINRQWDVENNVCFISIHPMSVDNMEYRDFYFDSNSMFFVFNSYGEGPDKSTTSSRVFYNFPIVNSYPDFSIEKDGDVVIKTVSGHLVRINGKKFGIKEFSPGTFTEKPLSKNNKGGVEIKPASGFWIDQGFKMGGMAAENKSGSTAATGSTSGTCSIKNSELYNYSGLNFSLRYQGEALANFITQKCPTVKY